jgi:cytochrome c biogenesis protein CcdA/thiol-disulfide isomerase/thioredoxin
MMIAILAFLGGALTILSPCVLPVLPFVFARSGYRFSRTTGPLLLGMAVTFASIATLAAVGGAWAVRVNDYGRALALLVLTVSGIALVSETAADRISRPFVALGRRLLSGSPDKPRKVLSSFVLGVATGFLWAPCAGPILGLILTGAAINGPDVQTTLFLFAYALGGISSLALATLAGDRVFAAMKHSLAAERWIRRGLGAAVIGAVGVIALGWDTGILTQLSLSNTNRVEQFLIDAIHPNQSAHSHGQGMTGAMTGGAMMSKAASGSAAPVEGDLPSLVGAVTWLNSSPLTAENLRGKVVLIDFWTYSCINCLRALPYVKGWYERYKDHGLVVLGVHSPEFAFEKNEHNVRRAVRDLGITYPVALDNSYAIWQAFNNRYWPAHYFVDAMGRIRGHHFGEGDYEESEQTLRQLLSEAGFEHLPASTLNLVDEGVQAAADARNVGSPETYLGYERAQNFASPGETAHDQIKSYTAPTSLDVNQWALTGDWRVEAEKAVAVSPNGSVVFRFHARDLHLVLGPATEANPIRFRITVDGQAPGSDHGIDTDASGNGVIRDHRLYQLLRQSGRIGDKTFVIEFLDSGAQVYSFTFG